jgi:hypothetical protein
LTAVEAGCEAASVRCFLVTSKGMLELLEEAEEDELELELGTVAD